ncbi:MAG: S8 family serine peptidase [Bacteroidota bacterium]
MLTFQLNSQIHKEEKLNFFLQSVLDKLSNDNELNIALHGSSLELHQYAKQKDSHFYPFKGGVLLKLTKEEILELNTLQFIESIEFDLSQGTLMNDQMLINNNVIPVHQGIEPLNSEYSGKGIIIGVIDSGIELAHPDFLDENNQTRVLYLWDHLIEDSLELIPDEYGYGNVWSKEDIDNGLSTHVDQIQYFGHGSVVTGVAASDGSAVGAFKGVAPDCQLIVVNSDFSRDDWLSSIADATDFIYSKAEELDMPCVINASLGTYFGSHDGLDANTLIIDSLINATSGRAFVCAAGNSGSIAPYHLKYTVTPDTSFTWFEYESNTLLGNGAVFFEMWADTSDFNQVQFGIGADKIAPAYSFRGHSAFRNVEDNLNQVIVDDIIGVDGHSIATVETWIGERGGQYQIQVMLEEPDSSQYYFRLMTTGSGSFDLWSTNTFGSSDMILADELPSFGEFPDILNYKLPDGEQRTVSAWACSENTLTVANYINRSEYVDYNGNVVDTGFDLGEISPTSSQGPTRDGKLKPDIAATGAFTLSSGSFEMLNFLINNEPFKVAPGGFHNRNGGTSMASPVIAGVSALIFEQCPYANAETILEAIQNNGISDNYTGAVPSDLWGNGKIDAFGAVNSLTVEGDLINDGDQLIASGGISYNWYLNDSLLVSGISDNLVPIETGLYNVEIIDDRGCIKREEEFFNFVGLGEINADQIVVFPNPSNEIINIRFIETNQIPELFDLSGRQINFDFNWQENTLVIDSSSLPNGEYILQFNQKVSTTIVVQH